MNPGHGVAHRAVKNAQNVQKRQKLENWAKNNKKNEKVLDISPEINATVLHTPACTQT